MTREEAIDKLQDLWNEVYNEDSDGYDYAVAIDMAIKALKGGDAEMTVIPEGTGLMQPSRHNDGKIEIVQCKDCKHQVHCHQTVSHTKIHDGFQEHWSETIEWCSKGERKGSDDK